MSQTTDPATLWIVRARRIIVAITIALAVIAGAYGGGVAESLSSGGFDVPGAESALAAQILADEFDAGDPDVALLVTAASGSVDDAEVASAATAVQERMAAEEQVLEVASYWSLGGPPALRSEAGDRALILVRIAGDQDAVLERAGEIREDYTLEDGGPISVDVGGMLAVFSELNETVENDLVLAEAIAFPLTMILLLIVFGSVVSALLPLGIGGLAIVGTFAVLQALSQVTEVSIFALNFTTAMGLGLAIDYSLLMVSRFREELDAGLEVAEAVRRTVRTAGRTVAFSAGTVASSLVALLVFDMAFLRSFAYAGIAVVGLAAIGAVVVLPAILSMVGHNVSRWTVRRPRAVELGTGMWGRIARTVMRRPVPIATVAILFLVLLAVPFGRVELGLADDRVLPEDAETRQVGDVLRDEFGFSESEPLRVIASDIGDPQSRLGDIASDAAALSRLEHVGRVDALTGSYVGGEQVGPPSPVSASMATTDATYLSVVPSVPSLSVEAETLVGEIRAFDGSFGDVVVGGVSAELVDTKSGLFDRMPLGLGLIALITFVVLFLSFGSVLLPLKAIALNLLSLTATFGAMVWIFQEGNLSGLLGFTATGTLLLTMPVLMFVTAFGLSMDYEVFLLSRIKEEYDRTGDDVAAVSNGLERTGRIVTAAALLMAIVFAAFATGGVSFMKMFGIGMTLAVLVDAFIVRATLVPAFMRLAGRFNWWAPAPMRRLYERYGFREHVESDGRVPEAENVGAPG